MGTQWVSPRGTWGGTQEYQGYPLSQLGQKNIQNLPDMLFVFEIFEIVQESRKLALCQHQLVGIPQGYPRVPR